MLYLFTAIIAVPGSELGLDKWLVVTLLSHPTHLPVTALSSPCILMIVSFLECNVLKLIGMTTTTITEAEISLFSYQVRKATLHVAVCEFVLCLTW